LNNPKADVVLFTYDLSQKNAIDKLFEQVLNLWGKIDVFVANAGFAYYEKLETANWQHIEKIYQVNTFAPIYSLLKMKELNKDKDFYVCITASAMATMGFCTAQRNRLLTASPMPTGKNRKAKIILVWCILWLPEPISLAQQAIKPLYISRAKPLNKLPLASTKVS
jgi:NAD(P)-dependent dehydrogenase (short-subunit alcohol dehydrogenase family)